AGLGIALHGLAGFRIALHGIAGLAIVGGLLRLVRDLFLGQDQLLQVLLGVFELGDVVAALFDRLGLLVEGGFGGFEVLDCLLLVRLGLGGLLVVELTLGLLGIVRGLVEGRLGLGVGRQGQVLQVVRFLGH